MTNEQNYFDTLKKIAKSDSLRYLEKAEKVYGVPYIDALEMAYENLQGIAGNITHGKRRPKDA